MGKPPAGWLQYSAIGNQIPGTRLIAFKVPLKQSFVEQLKQEERFTVADLLDRVPDLGLIIDLTFTVKYYNKNEILDRGVDYVKIPTPGQVVPPQHLIDRFVESVDYYIKAHENDGTLIGVHCTHGVNRTGYFLCKYLIQRLGFSSEEAIEAVGTARGHNIERIPYINSLHIYTEDMKKKTIRGDIEEAKVKMAKKSAVGKPKKVETQRTTVGKGRFRNRENFQQEPRETGRSRSAQFQRGRQPGGDRLEEREELIRLEKRGVPVGRERLQHPPSNVRERLEPPLNRNRSPHDIRGQSSRTRVQSHSPVRSSGIPPPNQMQGRIPQNHGRDRSPNRGRTPPHMRTRTPPPTSHMRGRSPPPPQMRGRSPLPMMRGRSPPQMRRRSPPPQMRGRSPLPQIRGRSPQTQMRGRSPPPQIRGRSPPPQMRGRSPPHIRSRTPPFIRDRTPPMRIRSSPSQMRGRSPQHMRGRTPPLVRGRTPLPMRGLTPPHHVRDRSPHLRSPQPKGRGRTPPHTRERSPPPAPHIRDRPSTLHRNRNATPPPQIRVRSPIGRGRTPLGRSLAHQRGRSPGGGRSPNVNHRGRSPTIRGRTPPQRNPIDHRSLLNNRSRSPHISRGRETIGVTSSRRDTFPLERHGGSPPLKRDIPRGRTPPSSSRRSPVGRRDNYDSYYGYSGEYDSRRPAEQSSNYSEKYLFDKPYTSRPSPSSQYYNSSVYDGQRRDRSRSPHRREEAYYTGRRDSARDSRDQAHKSKSVIDLREKRRSPTDFLNSREGGRSPVHRIDHTGDYWESSDCRVLLNERRSLRDPYAEQALGEYDDRKRSLADRLPPKNIDLRESLEEEKRRKFEQNFLPLDDYNGGERKKPRRDYMESGHGGLPSTQSMDRPQYNYEQYPSHPEATRPYTGPPPPRDQSNIGMVKVTQPLLDGFPSKTRQPNRGRGSKRMYNHITRGGGVRGRSNFRT